MTLEYALRLRVKIQLNLKGDFNVCNVLNIRVSETVEEKMNVERIVDIFFFSSF